MLKKIVALLIIPIIFLLSYALVSAETDIKVSVDGKEIAFNNAKPIIDEHWRTLIPIRFIAEELGATVNWDDKTQKVTIKLDKTISLKIGEYMVWINQGLPLATDTCPQIVNGRTFVPLRFVSECLGATVAWDGDKRIASISKSSESNGDSNNNDEKYRVIKENILGADITKKDIGNIHWDIDTSLISTQYTGIAYDGKNFIAIGKKGVIKTSPDGVGWKGIDSGVTDDLSDIAANGKVTVIVGSNGTILTSEDLKNWRINKLQIDPASYFNTLDNILWDGKQFIFMFNGFIYTSTDGYEWIKNEVKIPYSQIYSGQIAYDGKNYFLEDLYLVFSSEDLTHWNLAYQKDLAKFKGIFYDHGKLILYGEKFLKAGESSHGQYPIYEPCIMESLDGINWDEVPDSNIDNISDSYIFTEGVPGYDSKLGIAYNGNIYMKINDKNKDPNSISMSSDRIKWSPTSPDIDQFNSIDHIIEDKGVISVVPSVFPDTYRKTFLSLDNSSAWKKVDMDENWEVSIGNEKVISHPLNYYKINHEGKTWNFRGNSILKQEDGYLVAGYSDVQIPNQFDVDKQIILKFDDNCNYTVLESYGDDTPNKYRDLNDIAKNEIATIAVASGNDLQDRFILFSKDQNQWEKISTDKTLKSIACSEKQFVAAGEGCIMRSEYGMKWDIVLSKPGTNFNKVVWDGNKFIAVANIINDTTHSNQGIIMYSTDGVVWSEWYNNARYGFQNIFWTDSKYIVISDKTILIGSSNP